MKIIQKIEPHLWFDNHAEEAACFYVSVFDNSEICRILHYTDEGQDIHGMPAGSVMTIEFMIEGQKFTALNGGPVFKFTEAISFIINCETQEEIDYYWEQLTANGGEESVCGWLKDKFGVSWQVVPTALTEMMADPDIKKVKRMARAMFTMKKLDIEILKQAFEGKSI